MHTHTYTHIHIHTHTHTHMNDRLTMDKIIMIIVTFIF